MELNKTGNLDFGMLQTHPHVNDINKLKSRIDVYEDDELLFSGRSLTDEKDFQNTGQISCEGELSFLLDSIQRPHNYGTETTEVGTVETNIEVFKRLIQEHNSQDVYKRQIRDSQLAGHTKRVNDLHKMIGAE